MKTYDERIASVRKKLMRKRTQRKMFVATAGALCLCVAVCVAFPLFRNRNDVTPYEGSKYYKVIEAINRDFPSRPEGNWFEEMIENSLANGNFDYGNKGDMLVGAAPEAAAPGSSPDYSYNPNASVEITDHQVAGVLEADLIKRSQTHIFYLKGSTLEIYPIAGEETELLGTWNLEQKTGITYYQAEMYLSADATRINLIVSGYGDVFQTGKKTAFVQLISLDVADPANVKEASNLYVTGSLLSSRMVGDQMLLMAQYSIPAKIDFDDESTFLPQIGTEEDMQSINPDNILIPEKMSYPRYTLVVLLDGKEMTMVDNGAFMSYSNNLYVSGEHIYATRTVESEVETLDKHLNKYKDMSEISCMSYGPEGLELQGGFKVEGTIKNQYSMDEYNGIFRVVTGTSQVTEGYIGEYPTVGTKDAQGNTAPPDLNSPKPTRIYEVIQSANLTCFEVGTWKQVAQVAQFAPIGETVESVRFDGNYAYVCTAVVVTLKDPVFFFDMTDLNNITFKDTGTIEGYSSSLIQLNDGYLLGIGFDDNRNLKVEVYEECEEGVIPVCQYIKETVFATIYKAYYIDRENNLLGIPTSAGYILLQFDGYQLHELTVAENDGILENTRGVVIDEYLYVFSPMAFDVQKVGSGDGNKTDSQAPSDKGIQLIREENVSGIKVSSVPEGWFDYSFDESDAKAIVDYISNLNLVADFEENPDEYVGGTIVLLFFYNDGDVDAVYHFGNMFIRTMDSSWYKMSIDEACRLETLLRELGG